MPLGMATNVQRKEGNIMAPIERSFDDRTPAKIVAASENQSHALAAFIAQELEAWGFHVEDARGGRLLKVNADGYRFLVEVTRVD